MKTKNIFRMLLVAAVLLLGANNVKADTEHEMATNAKTIDWWNNAYDFPVTVMETQNAEPGDKIRLYGTSNGFWQFQYQCSPDQSSRSNITGASASGSAMTNSPVDIVLTPDMINQFLSGIKKGWVCGSNLTVNSIYFVKVDGFPVIVSNNEGGTVSVNKYKAIKDETITITVNPNQGYRLASLVVKDSGENTITVTNNQFSMPESRVTITATFEVITNSISIGNIYNGSVTSNKSLATLNEEVRLTLSPDNGFEYYNLEIKKADGGTHSFDVNNNNFYMPDQSVTINAIFKVSESTATKETIKSYTENASVGYNSNINFSTTNLKKASVGHIIRLHGTVESNYQFSLGDMNAQDITSTIASWNNFYNSSGQYGDIVIDENLYNKIQELDNICIKGSGFMPTSVELLYKDNDTRASVSLAFSEQSKELNVGDTSPSPSLTATSNGNTISGLSFIFSSSNEAVATVDETGIVTAVAEGSAQINAVFEGNGTYKRATATYTVNVSTAEKTNVTLSFPQASYEASLGESFSAPELSNPSEVNVTYSSTKTSVATVDSETGEVEIVGVGTTTIKAKFIGNDSYNPAEASYVLVVSASDDYYITISFEENADYATFASETAIDLDNSIGVEAYYATGLNSEGNEVQLVQATGTIEAYTPLVLKKADNATIFKVMKSTTGSPIVGNKLVRGPGEEVSGSGKYVLTLQDGVVAFAELQAHSAVIPTTKAYLDLSGNNARPRLSARFIKGNNVTGISGIDSLENNENVIYNLRGQRVENPTKGLYIINGKKVIIK